MAGIHGRQGARKGSAFLRRRGRGGLTAAQFEYHRQILILNVINTTLFLILRIYLSTHLFPKVAKVPLTLSDNKLGYYLLPMGKNNLPSRNNHKMWA